MKRALLIATALLVFAAPASAQTLPGALPPMVRVEVAPGRFLPMPYPSPSGWLEVVEDSPGHYVLSGRLIPPTNVTTTPPPYDPDGPVPEPFYSDQRAAPARLAPVIELAKRFWAGTDDRSLRWSGALDIPRLCPQGVTVRQAPTLGGAWGSGWHRLRPDGSMSCVAWLSDDLVAKLTASPHRSVVQLRDGCSALTHEIGHALGLPHVSTGVMAGEGAKPPRSGAWAPFFCHQWARNSQRAYLARRHSA